MLARGIACALYGLTSHTEEPFPTVVLQRYFQTWDRSELDSLLPQHLRALEHQTWPVVKDEFMVPEQLRAVEGSLYLTRSTLGNVQFLLTWSGLKSWWWYFQGLAWLYREQVEALWPEGVPRDDRACLLAAVHEAQVREDLAAAREATRPVYSYEELTANYSIAWPQVMADLGIEPTSEFRQFVQDAKLPPYFPLVEDRNLIERVSEVCRRAVRLYGAPLPPAFGQREALTPAGRASVGGDKVLA